MPPIALQLWSLKDDVAGDFSGTVARVAEIGYTGVELAGYGNLDVRGAKAALDAAGLKVAGMHVIAPVLPAGTSNLAIHDDCGQALVL